MGCGPQRKAKPLTYANTDIGQLRVTLVDAYLPEEPRLVEPTVKVRLTNQYYTSKPIAGTPGQNLINESYAYLINSFYQGDGRAIEVGLFEKDKLKAFGLVDANPIMNKVKQPQEFRCMLTDDKQQKFGYATLRAVFEDLHYTKITFQYETATIRRKAGGNVAIRTTVGEESLMTEYKKDTEEAPPLWNDQQLTFLVPEGTQNARVELIDEKENVIGDSQLDLADILEGKPGEEVYAAEELFYREKEKKAVDAATLKYSYVIGSDASFSQVKDVLKSSIRGARSKKELEVAKIEPPKQEE